MTHEKMMDYLYGELPEAERTAFEEWLQANPAAAKELKEMQLTRRMLQSVEDKQPKSTTIEIKTRPIIPMRAVRWMSIAASLGLLLWLSHPRIEMSSSGFALTFGQPSSTQVAPNTNTPAIPSDEDFQQILAQYDQKLNAKIDSVYSHFEVQLEGKEEMVLATLEEQLKGYDNKQKDELLRFVDNRYQENVPRIISNVQGMQLEQRQELKQMFLELWSKWQKIREADQIMYEQKLDQLRMELELQQVQRRAN